MVKETLKDVPELSVTVTESNTLSELPLTFQLARRHSRKLGVHLAPLADLAAIIQGLPSSGLVSLCQRLLAPLDGSGGLFETLDASLRHGGNSGEICAELLIHRNTLSYRLRKIEDLLGLDLSDGEVRATCLLALRVISAPT